MEFPVSTLEKLFRDPVMAAWCLFGAKLDTFQQARLRYYWFVPEKIDSSGWGTGKTIVDFLYLNLRCILIPNHEAGIYFPVFQTGKDEFWKYFNIFNTPLFQSQFRRHHNGPGEWKDPGCWRREFKNGSRILMPAPGFLGDANNQAGRSFNTLIIDEYTQAAVKGDGIDELIGRVRSPSYNKNHPIWANHILLSAHAEGPEHPAYRYVKAAKDAIAGKLSAREAQRNAMVSFCFLDWSPAMAKKYRHDDTINKGRRTLSRDEFRRKHGGIWTRSGRGWYSAILREKVLRNSVHPQIYRQHEKEYFVSGIDIAPGQSATADSCSLVDWRIGEVPTGSTMEITWPHNGHNYHIAPVYAHFLKNVDAPQLSGFIHGRHRALGYSRIVLDPGGGGAWVYKELIKPKQLIHNVLTEVIPLCSRDEPMQEGKQPIVTFFKRGSELDRLWHPHYLQGDEGIIEIAHTRYREAFDSMMIRWPQLKANRTRTELRELSEQAVYILTQLDRVWKQLGDVRVKTDKEKKVLFSKKGFRMFDSPKKKDGAYASLYGFCAVLLWLHDSEFQAEEEDSDVFMVS